MRPYREYMLYMLKAILSSMLVYSCFYLGYAAFFGAHLSNMVLLTGAFTALCSTFLHVALYRRHGDSINIKASIAAGILFSALVSLPYLVFLRSTVVSEMSLLCCTYLWYMGIDDASTEPDYNAYRDHFTLGLRILLMLAGVSIFFEDAALTGTMGRNTIAFIITGTLLLRNSREYTYVKVQGNKRADMINIGASLLVAAILLLASSRGFISCLTVLGGYILGALDRVLSALITVIAYPIGLLLVPIINWLLKLNLTPRNRPLEEQPTDPEPIPMKGSGIDLPYNVEVILKIILAAVIILLLIRVYRAYRKQRKKSDFSEDREFVFSMDEVRSTIRDGISSLASRFRKKSREKPTTLKDRIRYVYYDFLEISYKCGIYKKRCQTHRDVGLESQRFLGEDIPSVRTITDIYEKTRYSQIEVDEADCKAVEEGFIEIKERLKKRDLHI